MDSLAPADWLQLKRIVRFGDTDAAGVIHFYQLFRWCHEAWEESLENYGLDAGDVFPNILDYQNRPLVAFPIVHCEANFWKPLCVGDHLDVELTPHKINDGRFKVEVRFRHHFEDIASGVLCHQAINTETQSPCNLSPEINFWLEASLKHTSNPS